MEKQRNHNVHLTKGARRVRAVFYAAGIAITSFLGVNIVDSGNANQQNIRVIEKIVAPGQTAQGLIYRVNGPLDAEELYKADQKIKAENGGNYNLRPGEEIGVPDFNPRVPSSQDQHSSIKHAVKHAVSKVVHNSQTCKTGT